MYRAKKHQQRNKVIRSGKRAENVARNPRYHIEMNDHPNYRDFGQPHYIDAEGRQYKVAEFDMVRTATPIRRDATISHGWVKLYVRLPPGTSWFDTVKKKLRVTLFPYSDASLPDKHVVLQKRFLMQPSHRTGHVFVSRFDWSQI
jgi:hypothetical protein